MKVKVRIFGNLRETVPDYNTDSGVELEVKEGSAVGKLLVKLNIPENAGAVVVQNNQIRKKTDILDKDGEIRILQPLHGG